MKKGSVSDRNCIYVNRLVGKVAADSSHKWVFRDTSNEGDPNFISSWNVSIEPVSEIQYKSSY